MSNSINKSRVLNKSLEAARVIAHIYTSYCFGLAGFLAFLGLVVAFQ